MQARRSVNKGQQQLEQELSACNRCPSALQHGRPLALPSIHKGRTLSPVLFSNQRVSLPCRFLLPSSTAAASHHQHTALTHNMLHARVHYRNKHSVVPQALAGGGTGSVGGDKGNWGSGGGGGGGGDGSGAGKGGEGSGDQQPKKKGWAWKGWTDRVAADPEFPFKVLLEQVSQPTLIVAKATEFW